MRAPSISMVIMQKPLMKAMPMMTSGGSASVLTCFFLLTCHPRFDRSLEWISLQVIIQEIVQAIIHESVKVSLTDLQLKALHDEQ